MAFCQDCSPGLSSRSDPRRSLAQIPTPVIPACQGRRWGMGITPRGCGPGCARSPQRLLKLGEPARHLDLMSRSSSAPSSRISTPVRSPPRSLPSRRPGGPRGIPSRTSTSPSDVEAGGGQAEREREQGERGRHHLADGWPILLLRPPTAILAQADTALDRERDDRHGGVPIGPLNIRDIGC